MVVAVVQEESAIHACAGAARGKHDDEQVFGDERVKVRTFEVEHLRRRFVKGDRVDICSVHDGNHTLDGLGVVDLVELVDNHESAADRLAENERIMVKRVVDGKVSIARVPPPCLDSFRSTNLRTLIVSTSPFLGGRRDD